jgi:hypothetical protein
MKIQLEMTVGAGRVLLGAACVAILCGGGALAHAQGSQAATTTDTLVGSALSTLGNAVATLRAEVAILQTSERVARVTLSAAGGITLQTGAWIARVDHPQPGNYILTFTPGVFTTPPTCVATPNANEPVAPTVECTGVGTSSIACTSTTPTGHVNTAMSLICAGS